MLSTTSLILALAACVTAKPPSNSRTYAVDYFYGTGPLVEGRMDPIISPGEASGHVHTVMGGSNFALTMDNTTALGSSCTNSKPKADKSNYWWPKLYFHDPHNGSFIDVDLYYAKVYYFSEPTDDETFAFPPGFRMVTGSPFSRAANDKLGQLNIDSGNGTINPVQFVCGTENNVNPWPEQYKGGFPDPNVGGHGVGFPDANCDGYTTPLRYDLHFPSCYNPAAGLDDYEKNTVFPSSVGATQGQNCPKGWIHTPHVFIEVYWNTPPFADLWTPGQGQQPFVLANGDPTGYALHGDFLSGWEQAELQALIDNCDAGDAGFDTCADINSEGGVNDSSGSCTIECPIKEEIHGVLPQLPGCNPLQWGPGEATVQTIGCGEVLTNTNTATPAASKAIPAANAGVPAYAVSPAQISTTPQAAVEEASTKAPVASPAASDAAANNIVNTPVLTDLHITQTFTTSSASSAPASSASSSAAAAAAVAPAGETESPSPATPNAASTTTTASPQHPHYHHKPPHHHHHAIHSSSSTNSTTPAVTPSTTAAAAGEDATSTSAPVDDCTDEPKMIKARATPLAREARAKMMAVRDAVWKI